MIAKGVVVIGEELLGEAEALPSRLRKIRAGITIDGAYQVVGIVSTEILYAFAELLPAPVIPYGRNYCR